ncbi:MAG: ankyrin repeat domain-containing protein [Candidatus Sumerlaeota bacterium]|nr:ankyrin repeat domain-containing protein [Candidatus Sumerlaeota bacterium]
MASMLGGVMVYAVLCPAQESDAQRLLDAAKNGNVSAVQQLLEKGISPKTKDEAGRSPLHLAVANGHQRTAEIILQHGAEINTADNAGKTPLDLAEAGGHTALANFLRGKGGTGKHGPGTPLSGSAQPGSPSLSMSAPASRMLKPSLPFKTAAEFEKKIGEPATLLDSDNVCFFVPKRREKEARIIFGYLIKAYEALYEIAGAHTNHKIAVCAFPKGNPEGWGGTSDCSIEYDDLNLDLTRQPEWTRYKVPHVSGYIEEIAHSFVGATKAQFGWEMIGWSLGANVSSKTAGNPLLAEEIQTARKGQEQTFNQYIKNGFVFPDGLPANQCDRIHAWILYRCESKYGPRFWSDFFREIRSQEQALSDAARLGDADKIRNARYQITIACFDRLPGLQFKKTLKDAAISLTTDVKSLHPEAPGWNRRLTE